MRQMVAIMASGLAAACGDASQADANQAAPSAETAAADLPLPRGFYVAADTPCGQASNATLLLLRRDGIGGSRDLCTFKGIEATAPKRYKVTQECRTGGEAWGTEEQVETTTIDYEITGPQAFRAIYPGGYTSEARYCAQPELPEPWRDNDISDAIG